MASYNLSILTPDGKVYEGAVTSLTAPGLSGSFGILANHAPMIAATVLGAFKVCDDSGEQYFATGPGVLEVNQGNVIFLADSAVKVADQDAAKERSRQLA